MKLKKLLSSITASIIALSGTFVFISTSKNIVLAEGDLLI